MVLYFDPALVLWCQGFVFSPRDESRSFLVRGGTVCVHWDPCVV